MNQISTHDMPLAMDGASIRRAIRLAPHGDQPYPHWLPEKILPVEMCHALMNLPFNAPAIADTNGRRETHNSTRIFVSEANRARYPVCDRLAETFQDEAMIAFLQDLCDVPLAGSSLRIEYCLDTGGFWLEPHTDIGAKLFTMLIYLSDHPDAENWGTDIFDADHNLVKRASGAFNTGLIFVPGPNTWHGFTPRKINGLRRSLIVNYVKPEWRAREELAFPTHPVEA